MTTRLVQSDSFDVSAWSLDKVKPEARGEKNAMAKIVAGALRKAFADGHACQFDFGATIGDAVEAHATDLVMTLPFEKTGEAWEGPLLVISLTDVVQELVHELDRSEGDAPDPDGMAELRDGFHALANMLGQALHRNAEKIAHARERKAPRW